MVSKSGIEVKAVARAAVGRGVAEKCCWARLRREGSTSLKEVERWSLLGLRTTYSIRFWRYKNES